MRYFKNENYLFSSNLGVESIYQDGKFLLVDHENEEIVLRDQVASKDGKLTYIQSLINVISEDLDDNTVAFIANTKQNEIGISLPSSYGDDSVMEIFFDKKSAQIIRTVISINVKENSMYLSLIHI